MITIIGLIIAIYAIARLVQVPIEAAMNQEKWFGMPVLPRWCAIAGVSVVAVVILAILTVMLLVKDGAFSSAPSFPQNSRPESRPTPF